MRVAALADGLKHSSLASGPVDIEVTDITNNSRAVAPGYLYAALRGIHHDGHAFIDGAIASGACAILCETLPARPDAGVAWFVAPDPRMAMSELSAKLFGNPSHEIPVIGVTGTDGKTSTTSYLYQMLDRIDGPTSFLSTAAMKIAGAETPNLEHQSTPEAPTVHRTLRSMVDSGARSVVLESTSHGLSRLTARLAHVRYRAAVFTNLSHEHLEFHGTFERYRSDKANLFRALDAGCYADADARNDHDRPITAPTELPFAETFGVVNIDDPSAFAFIRATTSPIVTYGVHSDAHYRTENVELGVTGTRFTLLTPTGRIPVSMPIPGAFNVSNVLAAAAALQGLTGCPPERLADAIATLRSVRGRMSVVAQHPFSVVVDYAHTPGSFETVLPFFREHSTGRLIVLFGSAGDRDVAKRPLQGAAADRFADVIVLADEDPRSEDPMQILREIAAGCPGRQVDHDIFLIPDRRLAIRHAFELASEGDTVVLLGKGHEATIIGANETISWDELDVARDELTRLGYQ